VIVEAVASNTLSTPNRQSISSSGEPRDLLKDARGITVTCDWLL
jgi:hypothetical protein